jgi:hypothetical protein
MAAYLPVSCLVRGARQAGPVARSVMLLPDPDSPTRPSASPFLTSNDTPSTDRTVPCRLAIRTDGQGADRDQGLRCGGAVCHSHSLGIVGAGQHLKQDKPLFLAKVM